MKLLTPSIALLLLSRWLVPAPAGPLFASAEPIELTLEAPLQQLFDKGIDDDKFSVRGALSYRDAATGANVVVRGVDVSVRGHTSKRETECSFPKLKITFDKADARRQSV